MKVGFFPARLLPDPRTNVGSGGGLLDDWDLLLLLVVVDWSEVEENCWDAVISYDVISEKKSNPKIKKSGPQKYLKLANRLLGIMNLNMPV